MAKMSIITGAILILLGLVGYVLSGGASPTALIPAFFGIPMVILGVLGRNPARVKWTMHLAMGLMLLGLFGSAGGILKFIRALGGGDASLAAQMQALMAVVCAVFLALGIKSFRDARRRRE